MRVIHGIWAHGALCLWAEDPGLPQVPPDGPPEVRPPRIPRPHPFACQAAELAELLAALPGVAGEAARKAVDDELKLRLPSADGGPVASPGLIRPGATVPGSTPAARPARVALADWHVPVLAFQPAAALHLLDAVGHLGDLATAGGSLPYLAAVAGFADGLAARGRVLPVLAAEDGAYAARWRPVLGGADAQRARDLAAAMPPSCRAAGAEPPGKLLADALEGLADAAARARLPASLLPARRGRTPARIPVAERYVAALTSTDARIDRVTPPDEAVEAEIAELAADLDAWLDGALDTRTTRGLRCVLNLPRSPSSAEWRPPCAGLRRAYGPRRQRRFASPRPSGGCLACW
jgi:hypothetical protein